MSDLKERIAQILSTTQLSSMATLTADGKPWVRYVMITTDENLTIRCATMVEARKVKQIEANPDVHITCGITNPAEMKPYLQIEGKARVTTDEEERHGLWNEMLTGIFDGPDDPKYGIIIIEPTRIEYMTPGSHEPEVWSA